MPIEWNLLKKDGDPTGNANKFARYASGLKSHFPKVNFSVAMSSMEGNDLNVTMQLSVVVTVGLDSDSESEINQAAEALDRKASSLNGYFIGGTSVSESNLRQRLDDLLGHKPENEDVTMKDRIINYGF